MTGPVDVQAERLRELAAAATPGPWAAEPRGWSDNSAAIRLGEQDHDGFAHHSEANAAFIAACDPQTVVALVDELKEARALLAGQAEQIERAEKQQYEDLLQAERDYLAETERLAGELNAAVRRYDQLRNALRRIAENGVCTIGGVESKHQIFCPVHVARAALDAAGRPPIRKECTTETCAYGNFCCPNGCKEVVELDGAAVGEDTEPTTEDNHGAA